MAGGAATGLCVLFIHPWVPYGVEASRRSRIMRLLATRSDDEDHRLRLVQRFGRPMTADSRSADLRANLVARCGRGRCCSSQRIRGEDVEGVLHSGRSHDRVILCVHSRPTSRRSHSATGFEMPSFEVQFQRWNRLSAAREEPRLPRVRTGSLYSSSPVTGDSGASSRGAEF